MALVPSTPLATAVAERFELALLPGERWWGGAVEDGAVMPLGLAPFTRDLGTPRGHGSDAGLAANQAAPVLVSTRGRVIAAERPFRIQVRDKYIWVAGERITVIETGGGLQQAFLAASERFFPASGATPARELMIRPQYNTWIETPYQPTQESVLAYARRLLDAGMPAGVLMIDDSWSPDYGTWTFDPARFPDPRAMLGELTALGFDVMLWLVPFVSPDSAVFRSLEVEGLLVRDVAGRVALRKWWNGYSAVLDVTDPTAIDWLTTHLDALIDLGVRGFKFDGGDPRDLHPGDRTFADAAPVDFCEAWAQLGLRYPFNEFRACWRMGGQPLAQRLADKPPSWGPDGIGALIPEMLTQGMIGHAFTCPDMIGGGEIVAMTATGGIDQEFFVRYAQVSALSPMLQFSASPARVLDERHFSAVRAALEVRAGILPELEALAAHAASTGEPIVRPIAYHDPELADVTDQFLLGRDLLVAPVLERGATTRSVVLPCGRWMDDGGSVHHGPATLEVAVELESIPRFRRLAGR